MDWRESVNCQNCVTLNKKVELFELLKQKCCKNDDITKKFLTLKTSFEKSIKIVENKSRKLTETRAKLKELEKSEEFLKRKNGENQLRFVSFDNRHQEILKTLESERENYTSLQQEKLRLENELQEKENQMTSMTLISKQSETQFENEIEALKSKLEKLKESSASGKKELQAQLASVTANHKKLEKQMATILDIFKDGAVPVNDSLKRWKRMLQRLQANENAAKLEAELNCPTMTPDGTNSSDTGVFSADEDFGCPLANDLEVSSESSDEEFEDVLLSTTRKHDFGASLPSAKQEHFQPSQSNSPSKQCAFLQASASDSKQDECSKPAQDLSSSLVLSDDADNTLCPSSVESIIDDSEKDHGSPNPSLSRVPTSPNNTSSSNTIIVAQPETNGKPPVMSSLSNILDMASDVNCARHLTSPVSSPSKEIDSSAFSDTLPASVPNGPVTNAASNPESSYSSFGNHNLVNAEHPQTCNSVKEFLSSGVLSSTESDLPDMPVTISAENQCHNLAESKLPDISAPDCVLDQGSTSSFSSELPDILAASSDKTQCRSLTSPINSPSKVLDVNSSCEKSNSVSTSTSKVDPKEDAFELTFEHTTSCVEPDTVNSEKRDDCSSKMHEEAVCSNPGNVSLQEKSDGNPEMGNGSDTSSATVVVTGLCAEPKVSTPSGSLNEDAGCDDSRSNILQKEIHLTTGANTIHDIFDPANKSDELALRPTENGISSKSHEGIDCSSEIAEKGKEFEPSDIDLELLYSEWSLPSLIMPFSEDSSSSEGKTLDEQFVESSTNSVPVNTPGMEDCTRKFNLGIVTTSTATNTDIPQCVSTATSPIPFLSYVIEEHPVKSPKKQSQTFKDSVTSPFKLNSSDRGCSPVKISCRSIGVMPIKELRKNVALSPLKTDRRTAATSPVRCLFRYSNVGQSHKGTSPMKTVTNNVGTSTESNETSSNILLKEHKSNSIAQAEPSLEEDTNYSSWSQEAKILQQALEVLGLNSGELSDVVLDETLVDDLRQALEMALKKASQSSSFSAKSCIPKQPKANSFCQYDPCEFAELCNQQHYNLHLLAKSKSLEKSMCSFKKNKKHNLKRLQRKSHLKKKASLSFKAEVLGEDLGKKRTTAGRKAFKDNNSLPEVVLSSRSEQDTLSLIQPEPFQHHQRPPISTILIEKPKRCASVKVSQTVSLTENADCEGSSKAISNKCEPNGMSFSSHISEVSSKSVEDNSSDNETNCLNQGSSTEEVIEKFSDISDSNGLSTVEVPLDADVHEPSAALTSHEESITNENNADNAVTCEAAKSAKNISSGPEPPTAKCKPIQMSTRKRRTISSESSNTDCSPTVTEKVVVRRSPRTKKSRIAHDSASDFSRQGYINFVKGGTIYDGKDGLLNGSSRDEKLPETTPYLPGRLSKPQLVDSSSEDDLPLLDCAKPSLKSKRKLRERVSLKRFKQDICNDAANVNPLISNVHEVNTKELTTGKNRGSMNKKTDCTNAKSKTSRVAGVRKPTILQKLRSSVSKVHPLTQGSKSPKTSDATEAEEESTPKSALETLASASNGPEPNPCSPKLGEDRLLLDHSAVLEKFRGRESVRMAAAASGRTAQLIQPNQYVHAPRNAVGVHCLPAAIPTRSSRALPRKQPFVRPEDRVCGAESHVSPKPIVRPGDRISAIKRYLASEGVVQAETSTLRTSVSSTPLSSPSRVTTDSNVLSSEGNSMKSAAVLIPPEQTKEPHVPNKKTPQSCKDEGYSSFLISGDDCRVTAVSPLSCALADQKNSLKPSCDKTELKRTENVVEKTLKEFIVATSFSPGVLQKAIDALSPPDLYNILPVIVRDIVKMMDDDFDCAPLRLGKQQSFVPSLTPVQQQLVTLIIQLSCQHQHLKQLPHQVLRLLEYRVFRLGKAPEGDRLLWCSRLYAAICRILCLRSQALIFCWDSLYTLRGRSFDVVKAVMEVWPHLFPINPSFDNACPNAQVLLHLLRSHVEKQPGGQTNKFDNSWLKRLLRSSGLQSLSINSSVLASNIFNNLIGGAGDANVTAFVLLAKREEEQWTMRDIVCSKLLPALDKWRNKSLDDVAGERIIWALCSILRALPPERNGGTSHTLMKLLISEILQKGNGTVSPQMQEVMAIGLAQLSRHDIENVAFALVSWHPAHGTSRGYSSCLLQYLSAMINSGTRPVAWWQEKIAQLVKPNLEE